MCKRDRIIVRFPAERNVVTNLRRVIIAVKDLVPDDNGDEPMAKLSDNDLKMVAAHITCGMIAAASSTAFTPEAAAKRYFECLEALKQERDTPQRVRG
jgi:hypothetical protein